MIKVVVVDEVDVTVEGKELEAIVDRDLEAFSDFFCRGLGNSSLTGPEKAIVKTWLYWKLHEAELSAKYKLT